MKLQPHESLSSNISENSLTHSKIHFARTSLNDSSTKHVCVTATCSCILDIFTNDATPDKEVRGLFVYCFSKASELISLFVLHQPKEVEKGKINIKL